MTLEFSQQRRYPRIPVLAKWVTLVILVLGLAAGVATISERIEELSQLASRGCRKLGFTRRTRYRLLEQTPRTCR
jgi:membrane protein YqaA with SNARE-associated domain